MKREIMVAAIAFCFALAGSGPCQGEGMPEISLQRIAVALDPSTHKLTGESTVFLKGRQPERMLFDLSPNATVLSVTVAGKDAPVDFSAGTLVVAIPPPNGGNPPPVTVAYRAVFNDPVPERIVTAEDPSYGVEGVISNKGVFLGNGVAWYPRPRLLPGKRMTEITTPAGMESITAGKCTARRNGAGRNVSVWEEEHPVENLSLSAGNYEITERRVGALTLYTYLLPANAHLAAAYLDASESYLKFYAELFGPYPFEKFAVVENFIPTGYGFPSYTLLGGTVIRLPFILNTSLPHEIAHNWWGNGVLIDSGRGNWSEGLVTYLADYLLEEKKSQPAGRNYRYRILTDYASLVTAANDFPLTRFVSRTDPASRAIGYGKGAMVFHMIRKQIGDGPFFDALRELCRERLYRKASWDDFIRGFSRTSGKDLTPFVDQWLTRTGGPRLSLADVASHGEGERWAVSGRIVQVPPTWNVPVILNVATAGISVRQSAESDRESIRFKYALPSPPKRLLLDPDVDLFRLLPPGEIPPAINKIKGSRNLIAIAAKGCMASRETIAFLLESLGQKGAGIVAEERTTDDEISGHDLLICGIPEKKGLLPPLPGGVTMTPSGFAVGNETFSSRDDALLVVTAHPSVQGRVAALFMPLSRSAADACAAKITHYGRYGYLVFSRGDNRLKGLLPAAGNGMEVNF